MFVNQATANYVRADRLHTASVCGEFSELYFRLTLEIATLSANAHILVTSHFTAKATYHWRGTEAYSRDICKCRLQQVCL